MIQKTVKGISKLILTLSILVMNFLLIKLIQLIELLQTQILTAGLLYYLL